MSILRLPEEVYLNVLAPLDQKALASLSQSCRSLYKVVRPTLYSKVKLRNVSRQSAKFFAAVKDDPAIAKCTRSIIFEYMEDSADDDPASVLSFLSNLRHLKIGLPECDSERLPTGGLSFRSIDYDFAWSRNDNDITFCQRELCPFWTSFRNAFKVPKGIGMRHTHFTGLQTLQLISCDLGGHDLYQLLSIPKALRRIDIHYRRTGNPNNTRRAEVSDCMKSLTQQKDSLEYIFIHNIGWNCEGKDGFSFFPKLQMLRLEIDILSLRRGYLNDHPSFEDVLVQVLPRDIRTVILFERFFYSSLGSIHGEGHLNTLRSLLPNLSLIELICWQHPSYTEAGVWRPHYRHTQWKLEDGRWSKEIFGREAFTYA